MELQSHQALNATRSWDGSNLVLFCFPDQWRSDQIDKLANNKAHAGVVTVVSTPLGTQTPDSCWAAQGRHFINLVLFDFFHSAPYFLYVYALYLMYT